jgi:hypothetical protein
MQPDLPKEPVLEGTPRTMTHWQEPDFKEDSQPIVVKETLKLSDNFNLPDENEHDDANPADTKSERRAKTPKQDSPKKTELKVEEEDYEKDFDDYVE